MLNCSENLIYWKIPAYHNDICNILNCKAKTAEFLLRCHTIAQQHRLMELQYVKGLIINFILYSNWHTVTLLYTWNTHNIHLGICIPSFILNNLCLISDRAEHLILMSKYNILEKAEVWPYVFGMLFRFY